MLLLTTGNNVFDVGAEWNMRDSKDTVDIPVEMVIAHETTQHRLSDKSVSAAAAADDASFRF